MKKIFAATILALAQIVAAPAFLATSATIAHADEPRFNFSSRKEADASYARVFAQFSPDGTVSGGRAAIKRKKPTADEYFAAMARALNGKTAAEVVAEAEKIRE